ncbi:MAG: hypothetical protein QNJ16_16050 [Rhodobacter sp.]|nr:hypothetical protein [Rhodobacter sp.]
MEARAANATSSDRAERLYHRAVQDLLGGDGATGVEKLSAAMRLDDSHYKAVRLYAALTMQIGRDAAGREAMIRYFQRHPVRSRLQAAPRIKAALLSVRGFSKTRLIAARSEREGIKTTFRGGHFTTKFLLREPAYSVHRFTIAGENILRPGVVPEHGVMLNTIADPDLEGESLTTLITYLERHPETRVINRPEHVLKLTRDGNFRRFDPLPGVRFPETYRAWFQKAGIDEVAAKLAEFGLDGAPVIIRRAGGQTARKAARVRSRAELAAAVGDGLTGEHYIVRYIEELWQGRMFRKMRLFWIDGEFYPVVCHLDHHWNVRGDNRMEVMAKDPALLDEEMRYLADWRSYVGATNADRLHEIAGMVGLEWFGMDFNVDSEGRLLIYELNPAMRHSFEHGTNFPYKLPSDHRITDAFTTMVEKRLEAA